MRAFLMLLPVALLTSASAPPAAGLHGQTCNPTGATPLAEAAPGSGIFPFHATLTPENGWGYNPFTDSTTYNPLKFTMTLAPGDHYLVATQVVGDVDLVVCVPGAASNRHVCGSYNVILAPEHCLLPLPPNWPIVCFGPAPCEYVLYLFYCSGVECGYPMDVPLAAIAGVIV